MFKRAITLSLFVLTAAAAHAASVVGAHDFDVDTGGYGGLSGPSGSSGGFWQEDWQYHGTGGTFHETGSPIEGAGSLGVFGSNDTWVSRRHLNQPGDDTVLKYYVYRWKMRADFDITTSTADGIDNRIGGVVREGNDGVNAFGGQAFSVFFAEGTNTLQYFDGVDRNTGLTFVTGDEYSVTLTLRPKFRTYELDVYRLGAGGGALDRELFEGSYTTLALEHDLESFVFFGRGPGGTGNDFIFDSLSIIRNVPEPGTVAFLGLGVLILQRFHGRRKKWTSEG